MPLGDSITQGESPENPGYREHLWHLLNDDGYNVDFIGTLIHHYDSDRLSPGYDHHHEGHGGWRANYVLNGFSNQPAAGKLTDWLQNYTPDVVLLHIGTNDLHGEAKGLPNRDDVVVNRTRDEIEQIIDTLRADNPNVAILLGLLIPADPSTYPDRGRRIPLLNAALLDLANHKNNPSSPVIAVDHFSGFDPSRHTFDGLHPNQDGARIMAQRWLDTFITIYPPPPPPPPNQPPVATFTAEPASGIAPLEVYFNASDAMDPDGTIATYSWDFGDDDQATGPDTTHTYNEPGTYTVTLTITDDRGAEHSSSQEIVVKASSPPEPFALILPADKSTERTHHPLFEWEVSESPDAGDVIHYMFYVGLDSLFKDATPIKIDTTVYIPTTPLEENQRYWWHVEAVNSRGLATATDTRCVWIDAEPEPPRPATLIAPRDNDEITNPAPTFTWSPAVDNDPNDEPIYRLLLAADAAFTKDIRSLDVGSNTSATLAEALAAPHTFYWRVDAIDKDSLITQSPAASFTIVTGTGIPLPPDLPETYTLEQNYPNPFTSHTTIRFGIPAPAHVILDVYDLTGRHFATIIQQEMSPGWHEAILDASAFPSGLYIYQLRAGHYTASRKMLLIR